MPKFLPQRTNLLSYVENIDGKETCYGMVGVSHLKDGTLIGLGTEKNPLLVRAVSQYVRNQTKCNRIHASILHKRGSGLLHKCLDCTRNEKHPKDLSFSHFSTQPLLLLRLQHLAWNEFSSEPSTSISTTRPTVWKCEKRAANDGSSARCGRNYVFKLIRTFVHSLPRYRPERYFNVTRFTYARQPGLIFH